jgi:hypothetical protein
MCASSSPAAARLPATLTRLCPVERYSLMASLMELDRLLGVTLSRDVRFMDVDIACTCVAARQMCPEQ